MRREAGAVDQPVGHDVDRQRDGGLGEQRAQPVDQRLVDVAADHEVDVGVRPRPPGGAGAEEVHPFDPVGMGGEGRPQGGELGGGQAVQ